MPETANNSKSSGFTLVELVAGIIVFSVVLVWINSIFAPSASRSVAPLLQIRATELAQSMFNEISGKLYDENSDRSGGVNRCGEPTIASCTAVALLGPDSETRDLYDDVDDYNGMTITDGANFQDSLGNAMQFDGEYLYEGFELAITVFYDSNRDGVADAAVGDVKGIRVVVTPPNEQAIAFLMHRSNF